MALRKMISPRVVVGDRASNAAVAVDCPVPPRAIDSCPVHPSVKDVAASNAVVGVPPKVNVTLVSSTRVSAEPVTPMAPVVAFNVIGAVAEAARVPLVFGNVSVGEPAVACGVTVTVPDVAPENPSVPVVVPAIPKTGADVAVIVLAVSEANTVPAADVDG